MELYFYAIIFCPLLHDILNCSFDYHLLRRGVILYILKNVSNSEGIELIINAIFTIFVVVPEMIMYTWGNWIYYSD